MTDKTEAQPEALRLEVHQECADFATSLRSAANTVHLEGKKVPPSFLRAADLFERASAELRRQHAEIQQLKAQLSARQAAPVLVVTEDMHVAAVKVLHRASGVHGLPQRMLDAMLSAAPSQPEREPLSHEAARKLVWSASTWSRSEGVSEDDVLEVIAAVERAQGIGATND